MPAGQPSKYTQEYAVQAEKLCALGATNRDLADFFGVTTRTIENWLVEHEGFFRSVKTAKAAADDKVERSLYQKAMGYSFEAVKIFMPAGADAPVYAPYVEHVPPSDVACIFWLKNRRPEDWREKTEHEHSGNLTVSVARFVTADYTPEQLETPQIPAPTLGSAGER